MASNEVSMVISQVNQDAIILNIRDAMAVVTGYVTLTPAERKKLHKMGDLSYSYVMSSYTHADQHASLVTNNNDMPEYKKDVDIIEPIKAILSVVDEFKNLLEDTLLKVGAEAMYQSDVFYETTKTAAKRDAPGAKAIVEDLKTRYAHAKKEEVVPPTNGTDTPSA